MKDLHFKNFNAIFKAASKDLKRQGLGSVDHYPPVEVVDLQKAYFNFDLYSAKSLQRKVFMDIMLYFGRRGRENLRELKITDLALTTDADGLRSTRFYFFSMHVFFPMAYIIMHLILH
jgi:hypothetical protein